MTRSDWFGVFLLVALVAMLAAAGPAMDKASVILAGL